MTQLESAMVSTVRADAGPLNDRVAALRVAVEGRRAMMPLRGVPAMVAAVWGAAAGGIHLYAEPTCRRVTSTREDRR